MRGIDISNWQAGLQIRNVATEIDFVICKATEGTYYVDPCCNGFIEQAMENGLLWGFYHFAGCGEPESEAEFFYSNCSNYFHEGIPVLDYEIDNYDNRFWCERFLQRLYELSGVWAMLYISAYRCPQYEGSWIPKTCGLWLAGYPYEYTSFTDDPMPYCCSPWECAAIWQFTSSLYLNGYASNLDGDIAYIDVSQWHSYANCTENVTTENPKPKKSILDLAREVILGEWGNGENRVRMLTQAGYNYQAVQDCVNAYLQLAQEIIAGKWGNGWNREIAVNGAGYSYEFAQWIVNRILED